MSAYPDLLGGPPPTLLPAHPASDAARSRGAGAVEVAAAWPQDSTAWAELAEAALERDGDAASIEAYAYARVGYHRGLDQLRRHGWKGHGPVPWSHEGNRGWLRAVAALEQAARRIGEVAEVERLQALLHDSDPHTYPAG